MKWTEFLSQPSMRYRFLTVLLLDYLIVVLGNAKFFVFIEGRSSGMILNDFIHNFIGPFDLSSIIVPLTYSPFLLILLWHIKKPLVITSLIEGIIILNIFRMITILLVPLDPPLTIIPLDDPILANSAYSESGSGFISKDLFFSGHVAHAVLFIFYAANIWLKRFFLLLSIILGILVIAQHIHYTIDVLAAPFFAYLAFMGQQRFIAPRFKHEVLPS